MGSGAAGQPMNSDNPSWPFASPAGRDASKPHEIDLYIEPSPRDSPTALPKLFTTLEPTALPANAHVEEDLSSTPPARESPPTLPSDTAPARAKPPARTVEFYQASPGVADVEFFVEEDDDPPSVHAPMTYDEVMRRRRPAPAPAPAASDLVPAWLSNYWS